MDELGTCERCGQAVVPGAAACASCGAPVRVDAPPPASGPPAAGQAQAPGYGQAQGQPQAPGYGQAQGQPQGYGPPAGYGPPSGYAYGYGYAPPTTEHPSGTTVLVLGILGIVLCQILGPIAWSQGNKVLREIDASPGRYSNRGSVQAGRILGMIGTGLLVLSLLYVVAMVAFVGFLGTTASSSSQRIDAFERATLAECRADTKTLKTATMAWHAEYLSGSRSAVRTLWPTSEDDLTRTGVDLLAEPSELHDRSGDGTHPPTISKALGQCPGEEIVQLD